MSACSIGAPTTAMAASYPGHCHGSLVPRLLPCLCRTADGCFSCLHSIPKLSSTLTSTNPSRVPSGCRGSKRVRRSLSLPCRFLCERALRHQLSLLCAGERGGGEGRQVIQLGVQQCQHAVANTAVAPCSARHFLPPKFMGVIN